MRRRKSFTMVEQGNTEISWFMGLPFFMIKSFSNTERLQKESTNLPELPPHSQ
jgi:hypothetical protein